MTSPACLPETGARDLVSDGYETLPASILYFPQPEIRFSRVSDGGAFSPKMVPGDRTLLCLEFPCGTQEPAWAASVEDLADHARTVLEAHGLIPPGSIRTAFVERISHSYPRFAIGYAGHLKRCYEAVATHDNVISFGRQGGFAYINTDGVVHEAFLAAQAARFAGTLEMGCDAWFRVLRHA